MAKKKKVDVDKKPEHEEPTFEQLGKKKELVITEEKNRCLMCNYPIAEGEAFCSECLCEDDSEL